MGQLVFVIRVSVPFTSLCQRIARCLPQARCLCSENVAIGFKTNIEAYFMEKNSARMPELLEVSKLRITFEQNFFIVPYCDESIGISLL